MMVSPAFIAPQRPGNSQPVQTRGMFARGDLIDRFSPATICYLVGHPISGYGASIR